MVMTSYELNHDVQSQPFPSVRGEPEVEADTLSYEVDAVNDADEVIGLTRSHHLSSFITKWGLQRPFDEFPRGWGLIEDNARSLPGKYAYVNELQDGRYTAVQLEALYAAIQILYDGSKSYVADDLTLWAPSRPIDDTDAPGSGPWVIESRQVPKDWIVHGEFSGEENFTEVAGEDSGDRDRALEIAREQIDSILLLIAPDFPDTNGVAKIEADDGVDVEEAIEAYKEETGDVHLTDEDALDRYLEAHDVL
jgi:hypothetical protein